VDEKTKAAILVRNNSLPWSPASLTISMMSCSRSPYYLPKIHKIESVKPNSISTHISLCSYLYVCINEQVQRDIER
jgi:hypothetical protein